MEYIAYLFLALLILLMMITIHELGHYLAGKLLKFKINEFAVGFGPKLFSKKSKKTGEVFSIRAIPLGGFCAFEGESGIEEENPEVFEENTANQPKELKFNDHAPWKRIVVFAAGGVFNLLSAIIFSFIFILAVGLEKPAVIKEVYLYDNNGEIVFCNDFEVGDTIISVNGKKLTLMYTLNDATSKIKKDNATFVVRRFDESQGKMINVTIPAKIRAISAELNPSITEDYNGFGYAHKSNRDRGLLTAIKFSVPYMGKMSWLVISIFGKLITGQVPLNQMAGPVGTIDVMAKMSILNWRNILLLLPIIAANLGIFNLLPIPALDGSKIAFASVEWIRKKPLNRNIENTIHAVGLLLLLGFVIFIEIAGGFARCGL